MFWHVLAIFVLANPVSELQVARNDREWHVGGSGHTFGNSNLAVVFLNSTNSDEVLQGVFVFCSVMWARVYLMHFPYNYFKVFFEICSDSSGLGTSACGRTNMEKVGLNQKSRFRMIACTHPDARTWTQDVSGISQDHYYSYYSYYEDKAMTMNAWGLSVGRWKYVPEIATSPDAALTTSYLWLRNGLVLWSRSLGEFYKKEHCGPSSKVYALWAEL